MLVGPRSIGLDSSLMGLWGPIFMKRESRRQIKELTYYASIGMSVALSVFIGLFIGVYLDGLFGTQAYLMFIFLVLGIAAGFRNIGLAIKKARRY